MMAAVNIGPVAVSVNAVSPFFQFYQTGVIDTDACGTNTTHAVLVVGYGTDTVSSEDYWLVKNSYGTSWGEDGYARMAIVPGAGICGIQKYPNFATVN